MARNIGNVKPRSVLTWTQYGRQYTYDDTWLLGDKVVRVCRPADAGDGEKLKGSLKVQFLMSGEDAFVNPNRLVELTPAARVKLGKEEFESLKMYDIANEGCLGVNTDIGGRLVDTAFERGPTYFKPGDDAWLTGLQARPEINGKHVMLEQWVDSRQRWRCLPMHWPSNIPDRDEPIGIKLATLTKTPPAEADSFQQRLEKAKTDQDITDLLRNTSQADFRKFAASYGLCPEHNEGVPTLSGAQSARGSDQ